MQREAAKAVAVFGALGSTELISKATGLRGNTPENVKLRNALVDAAKARDPDLYFGSGRGYYRPAGHAIGVMPEHHPSIWAHEIGHSRPISKNVNLNRLASRLDDASRRANTPSVLIPSLLAQAYLRSGVLAPEGKEDSRRRAANVLAAASVASNLPMLAEEARASINAYKDIRKVTGSSLKAVKKSLPLVPEYMTYLSSAALAPVGGVLLGRVIKEKRKEIDAKKKKKKGDRQSRTEDGA